MKYINDRLWADQYIKQVKEKIISISSKLAFVNTAGFEKDTKFSTDLILKTIQGDSAVRLRRSHIKFRDLTIRAKRDSGVKTELEKIKKGWGRWYFYGWVSQQDKIEDWIFVDLNKLRKTNLLDRSLIDNKDGTYFIAISKKELERENCLVLKQEHSVEYSIKSKSYRELFDKDFTPQDFEKIKAYNKDKNRKCWLCLRAYKKDFNELSEADKYHITVCNPWMKYPTESKEQI